VDLTSPKPVQVKEEGADNPPTTTALTPLEIFKADWCELKGVDPQNMNEFEEANFLMRWQIAKPKL
jgi:hypothetical protein